MTDQAASATRVPRPDSSLRRIAWILALTILVLKAAILVVFALTSRYVMDELAQAGYSLFIPSGFYRGFHDAKTVLYVYYFDLARLLTHDSVHLMRAARIEGLILAFGMAFFVFRTVRNLGFGRLAGILTVGILTSFSTFMEQSFRVRSDVCAVFFSTAALWWATRPRNSAKHDFVTGILAAMAFLSTQKAAYVILAIGAGIAASQVHRHKGRPFLRSALITAAGFWVSLAVYAVYFGGLHFFGVLREVFEAPIRTASIHGHEAYPGIRRYVWVMLGRNSLPLAICGVGMAFAIARWRRLCEGERFALAFTFVVSAAYFSYEQPWPYVLLWPLPALAAWTPYPIESPVGRSPRIAAAGPVVIALLVALSFPRNFQYLALSNHEQEQTMGVAESLLRPNDRYADGLWMLPTRFHASRQWWDAYNLNRVIAALNQGDSTDVREIFAEKPKVWITNYRISALWPVLRPRLARSYVPVYPGILLTGCALAGSEPASFSNWWPGRYSLYAASGLPSESNWTINGLPVTGSVLLTKGTFSIACPDLPANQTLFLLPSNLTLPGKLPAPVWGSDQFAGVYDF